MGECQIIIERMAKIAGSAKKYTVELDGIVVGELGNGKTLSIPASEGAHTLSFSCFGKTEKSVQVNLDSQTPVKRFKTGFSFNGKIDLYLGEVSAGTDSGKRKRRHPVLIGVSVFILLAIIVGMIGDRQQNTTTVGGGEPPEASPSPEQTEEQIEVITVSAEQLYADYIENAVNADNLYKDKIISVTGEITDIGQDIITHDPCVSLDSGTSYSLYPIQCFFSSASDDLAGLRDGDVVTITGECTGYNIAYVQLADCSLQN